MEIKFTYVGLLVIEEPRNFLKDDILCLVKNGENSCVSSSVTPRSSYYSSSPDSSNCTPKSITTDLTNVPDLVVVKKIFVCKK